MKICEKTGITTLEPSDAIHWTRLGDALPEICEPILLAYYDPDIKDWRVRDAKLYVRHEGVRPDLSDLAGEKRPTDWWFDSCYPGRGDMRLGTANLFWVPMPKPGPRHITGVWLDEADTLIGSAGRET